jgi:hypothetical protein
LKKEGTSFDKKKQKTLTHCGAHASLRVDRYADRNMQKFFGSFFQKRTASFPTCAASQHNLAFAPC